MKQCAENIILFAKLKSHALHPNSPNLLFTKYTAYTVYVIEWSKLSLPKHVT